MKSTVSIRNIRSPNGKAFHFSYRKPVKGNQYGRQEEYYTCENCSGCPYAEQCKRAEKNRTVRINAELTAMHQEVLDNFESIHGALLRMNRSIQAEDTFGIMKYDRWHNRIVRRGLESNKAPGNYIAGTEGILLGVRGSIPFFDKNKYLLSLKRKGL